MTVPAAVVAVADPLPSTHAATRPACAHVERAAIECHGRIAGPRREKKRVTGVSEQAVLGGGIPNANDVDSAPRSHDDGVAIAAVVRLYGAPFNSASRVQARAAPGYARHIRGPQIAYLGLCERQYRPVAGGAGHINCGVRGTNDGAAARLYSQPGVVVAKRIGRIVDGYIVDYIDSDVIPSP